MNRISTCLNEQIDIILNDLEQKMKKKVDDESKEYSYK